MKFSINFSSVAPLLVLAPVAVTSHAYEIRKCLTTDLNLRVFIRHWHVDSFDDPAGLLYVTDHINGVEGNLALTGNLDGVPLSDLATAGDCGSATTDWVTGCTNSFSPGYMDNWVYYDFPSNCETPVKYTFDDTSLTGFLIQDACAGYGWGTLYPATVEDTTGWTCPPGVQALPLGNPITIPEVYTNPLELKKAWNMDNPTIEYIKSDNRYRLIYHTTNYFDKYVPNINLNEEFYDTNCKTGTAAEYTIDSGIGGVDFGVSQDQDAQLVQVQDNGSDHGELWLEFDIDPAILTKDSNIYSTDGDGSGQLDFCVRATLGYNGTADRDLNLKQQIEKGFREVNFIETLLTIKYNLTSGFDVLTIEVEPKEKASDTRTEDAYGLMAYLCKPTDNSAFESVPFSDGGNTIQISVPEERTETFNQGALVSVCVRPDNSAYEEGIVMDYIKEFTWKRDNTIPGQTTTIDVTQPAITTKADGTGEAANNLLTYYSCTSGDDYCHFSSILFADFYISEGLAQGSGAARTKFKGTRRLNENDEGRALQEAGPVAGENAFDIAIGIQANDDGPGALKTAGSVSLGFTALGSFMALAGSMLFF